MSKSFNWLEEGSVDQIVVVGKVTSASNLVSEEGCNTCPSEYPLEFRDMPSYKEYKISGICQKCQDKVFGRSLH